MAKLNPQQLTEFLTGGSRLMKLATLTADGYPYVTPVWYHYDGDAFYLAGRRKADWVANIRRDERVSFCIDTPDAPYTRVVATAAAHIVDDAWLGEWRHWAVRYLGEDAGGQYYDATKHMPRAYIRIVPHKLTSWAGPGWHPRYEE